MSRYILFIFLFKYVLLSDGLNLDYLDPTKLQTKTTPVTQQDAAKQIISKYLDNVIVEVNPLLFNEKKDVFALRTTQGQLQIRASSGVAAVWGFNYYLKKYCKSHIGWQVSRVSIPNPLPEVDEVVIANDRFRYYQNVCTASYSFVWWDKSKWTEHVEWMALNGINMALAPVAQESAWAKIYRRIGLTDDEIDEHFTGPAFLSWQRMGNVRGWGGPLKKSWHDRQRDVQDAVIDFMYKLGIVPIMPAFSGHVPRAFSRIYPNTTFFSVGSWNNFSDDYCCGLFLDPSDPLFKEVGKAFLREITKSSAQSHIYTADPFNEIQIEPWSTALVQRTAVAIFSTLFEIDPNAVWLVQNWMFVHDPILWPKDRVRAFITSVPNGRMLVLDLQSEQWPQFQLYDMYFGQPFIWSMLHNFGGTLGMFGNMKTINKEVYEARLLRNSTMIGVGLTPEGINQNYVVYELMLESAWRKTPVENLNQWLGQYAERRYGCNATSGAWRYLLKSVYSFDGLNRMRGKYVITRRPSFRLKPWAWYSSHDLFEAYKRLAFTTDQECMTPGFEHDLVDVSRQALQYRAEQLYINLSNNRNSNFWVFNASIAQFLDVMNDMQSILASNNDFSISDWLSNARNLAADSSEQFFYELNARNQITLWGPNGEISDYACKQWAELFKYYYIPRWATFLSAAVSAKLRNEYFDEKITQNFVRAMVEDQFVSADISSIPSQNTRSLAMSLYEKWAHIPGLPDLPNNIIKSEGKQTTMADVDSIEITEETQVPTIVLLQSTSPS